MKKQLIKLVLCLLAIIALAVSSIGKERYSSSWQRGHQRIQNRHRYNKEYKHNGHGKKSMSIGFKIGGIGVYFNSGHRRYRRYPRSCWRAPVYYKRYHGPIVRYIEDDYRLYQPRVRGHVAFLQRWSSYERRWVIIKEHPSIY